MNKNKRLVILLSGVLVLLAGCILFLWLRFGGQTAPYTSSGFSMGSVVQQTVYGSNTQEAAMKASAAINKLDSLISWRESSSNVSILNEQAGVDWVTLDEKTMGLLIMALDVAEQSDGAFDPTILPLSSLWNFDSDAQTVPTPENIADRLGLVNYKNLRLNAQSSKASLKSHYMGVDLGAVGKGAACDEAVTAYREAGVGAGLVAVGGSVGLYGEKPGGKPWLISVRDPNNVQGAEMGVLELKSGFVSTSGTYEKKFVKDGKTYHHLLNPKTGYPEENDLVSVTVVCGNGALSDTLSTACIVLGLEKGSALLQHYNAGGIFVDKSSKVTVTEPLKTSFRIVADSYGLSNG